MSGLLENGTAPSGGSTGSPTAAQIAASLAANPQASLGAYGTIGSGVTGTPIPGTPTMPSQYLGSPDGGNRGGTGVLTTADWQNLIAGDAGLQSAEAALNGSQAADQNALGAEFTNAYETFGKPVDLSALASQLGMTQADIQNYLGADAAKVAQENTDAGTSTTARLDQANQNATRSVMADLNKRGILNSGETGYQLDQQNLGYRQAQQDAYSKFLGYLQQYQQGYLSAQKDRAAALAAAISAAADRQYGLNQSFPGASAGSGSSSSGGSSSPGGSSSAPSSPNRVPASTGVGGVIPGSNTVPAQLAAAIVAKAIANGEPVSEHGLGQMGPSPMVVPKPPAAPAIPKPVLKPVPRAELLRLLSNVKHPGFQLEG